MKRSNASHVSPSYIRRLVEGSFIALATVAIFLLLALLTFHSSDPSWSNASSTSAIQNAMGRVGAWVSDILLYSLGYIVYLLPIMLVYSGWLLFRQRDENAWSYRFFALRALGFLLVFASAAGLFHMQIISNPDYLPYDAGGIIGASICAGLIFLFNDVGTNLILLAGALAGITLSTGLSWLWLVDKIGEYTLKIGHFIYQYSLRFMQNIHNKWRYFIMARKEQKAASTPIKQVPQPKLETPHIMRPQIVVQKPTTPTKIDEVKESGATSFAGPKLDSLPTLALLEKAQEHTDPVYSKEVLEALSRSVEARLKDFNIHAQVVAVYPGPVITRFELDLAAGTKASKLTTLSRDLARALSVQSVRIVEVIPGKSVVGLEIPNDKREIVRLSEIISSDIYAQSQTPLTMALGKDIAGSAVITDLAKMPHLLVAGTTGSGKSVGLNAMLLSMLYKSTPEQLRLIMIDPKMLELAIYDGIPHLLTPVITDMKEAANALRWAIAEMDRRYRLMAALGVRNMDGYNSKVRESLKNKRPIPDPLWPAEVEGEAPDLETLPFIVILVDEFADMMMVVGKKVEELIARLAQKARASGIHLIVATQRPSVDVITGLIKANIPARIAFQVSSRVDSRTILDQLGAEQLLGHGDMLYMATGKSPERVHGAFVADDEVHNVVKDLKSKGRPNYLNEVVQGSSEVNDVGLPVQSDSEGEVDALFDEAVAIIAKTRRASISNVQRRLKIGYNRAARILEEMEAQGMVSPMESNGSREVLLPAAEE